MSAIRLPSVPAPITATGRPAGSGTSTAVTTCTLPHPGREVGAGGADRHPPAPTGTDRRKLGQGFETKPVSKSLIDPGFLDLGSSRCRYSKPEPGNAP